MIYSLRHPLRQKRSIKNFGIPGVGTGVMHPKPHDFKSPEAQYLLAEIQKLQEQMKSKTITVTKPEGPTPSVLKNSTDGISPVRYKKKYNPEDYEADICGYPIKRDLNPKLEPVLQPVTLETAMSAPSFETRETIATVARRSALNAGVPPRKLV